MDYYIAKAKFQDFIKIGFKIYIQFIIFTALLVKSVRTEVLMKCTNQDQFYYSKPGSHCTSFYKCENGHSSGNECDPGSIFDFYKQICTRNAGVCYEPVCTGRTNGVYQDTTHACRRSFTCHAGRLMSIDNCPPYNLHNGFKCVAQELVMCDLPHTTAIGYPFAGDNRCFNKSDGSYAIEDCSNYIICENNEVIQIKSCSQGNLFINELRRCIPANQISHCESVVTSDQALCLSKNDGANFDPATKDCKSFINCRDGQFQSREFCGQQAIFNGESCIPEPLYTCPMLPANDVCRRQSNGFNMNPRLGCSSYVRCMSNRTVESFDCPAGQYFDPEERNCIFEKFSEHRKCIGRELSEDCANMPQGFYQDTTARCNKYYFCLNGFKTEYKCSVGKLFDGENCVNDTSYKCPSYDPNSCVYKPDGYYADTEGGCRSYFYCVAGRKLHYLCDEGQYFDGNSCTKSFSTNQKCSSNEFCAGKSDGYHADLSSNCRNYVYCSNGEKYAQLTCRGSKIFNGDKCVSPRIYTCPSHSQYREPNCISQCDQEYCRQNGFFPDIESECRTYYFCIDGQKSIVECPAKQVFNGDICVPQDRYTCPVYCKETVNSQSCPLGG